MKQKNIALYNNITETNHKITLKPIGKNKSQKAPLQKNIQLKQKRINDHYQDETIPQNQQCNLLVNTKSVFKQAKNKFNVIEDPHESSFTHEKFIFFQKANFFLVSLTFMLEITKTQIDMMPNSDNQVFGKSLTDIITFSTILIIAILFLRHTYLNELQIDQKKFYAIRKSTGLPSDIWRVCSRWPSFKYFLLQVLFILPHPMSSLSGQSVTIFQSYDEIQIRHQINNILAIISLTRVYIVFRSLVNLSIYSTPRSSRLCSHNGVDHNFLYSLKCLLRQKPLYTIGCVFVILLITLGYGLNLSEGTLIRINPHLPLTGFQNLQNCFWCIFITMPTVGYGDFYPKTMLGRIIIFITAICGVIISSLLIVSLSNYLTMEPYQSKSHLTLQRLEHQQQAKKQAKQALIETMKISRFLKSKQSNDKSNVREFFSNLKRKIDAVKLRNRKIKSLVNTDNLIQEMNRLFSVFKESLQQIYRKQIVLRDALVNLDERDRRSSKIKTAVFTKKIQDQIEKKFTNQLKNE